MTRWSLRTLSHDGEMGRTGAHGAERRTSSRCVDVSEGGAGLWHPGVACLKLYDSIGSEALI